MNQPGAEPPQASQKPPLVILYRPRVVLGKNIILSRKRWHIPQVLFPGRRSGEAASRYYERLGGWRRTHGIPSEVFMRIQAMPPPRRNIANDPSPADDQTASVKNQQLPRKIENHQTQQVPAAKPSPLPTPQKAVSRDLYKPQYIDFENPLLVELFGHISSSLERFSVTLEERLPNKDQLIQINNDRYVTEFILQLNFPEVEESASDSLVPAP
jgi:hypothetical protein